MLGNLGGWTAIIILVVILLLFGATKLPALAKSVGQSAKIFKKEMAPEGESKAADEKSTDSATQQ
ncbi:MAG TPA: twin-arginine translocase TatA/TatE family subunit [Terrimesophilobacter sp.]|nr:twin-arginine translocase TatA/TatE family subunit [Terrimesophilobacter sp.]HRQ00266.1 twin-arginine translocase TatA/TatE family subunit [Terrimesophilobacter sp.]